MSRRLTLAVLSAVLYILAFPKFSQSGLAWVALVPLALAVSPPRRDANTPLHSFLLGWLAGTLAYSGLLYWIIVTFQAAHLSIFLASLCLFLIAGYLGLYWAVWAWFLTRAHSAYERRCLRTIGYCGRAGSDFPLKFTLMGAAAWVALEYLRTYLFSGFPWTLLADSQIKSLPLIQVASVTGVYGVSFLIIWFNLAVAAWRPKPFILALTAVILTGLFGYSRMKTPLVNSAGREIRVALLQGNIDQYKKWNKSYVEEIERTYDGLVARAASTKPDMIIWPETSVPGYLLQEAPLREWLLKIIRKSGANHLVGVPVIHDEIAYNSAFSITRESILEGEYAKQHLVPFGEVVPWSRFLGRFISVLNDLGGFAAGTKPPVLEIGGVPVGVNICYEAIFPNLVRQSVQQGAQVIANLTNDGWYMRTAAPYQHWAPNIFRAVENDRWLIRADNSGISGIVDPRGRVQKASPIFETTLVQGTVYCRKGLTLYTRWGDFFAWFCVLFCAWISLRDILRP